MPRTAKRYLWLLLAPVLIGCSDPPGLGAKPTPTPTLVIFADCRWEARARAWVDENGDGSLDPGEPPLAGVQFAVDDTVNSYRNVDKATSDASGEGRLFVFVPGCPRAEFAVRADPPAGYRLTTPSPVPATGSNPTIQFGFARSAP